MRFVRKEALWMSLKSTAEQLLGEIRYIFKVDGASGLRIPAAPMQFLPNGLSMTDLLSRMARGGPIAAGNVEFIS
jgi:hypothetical protein